MTLQNFTEQNTHSDDIDIGSNNVSLFEFIHKNDIIKAMASYALAFATKDYIYNVIYTVIFPSFGYIFDVDSLLKFIEQGAWKIPAKLLEHTLTLMLMVIFIYFIVEHIINRNILGTATKMDMYDKIKINEKKI